MGWVTHAINGSQKTTILIPNGAVTTAKIADLAVTTAKIDDEAVSSGKIAASGVTTSRLNDSAVTTAKINNGDVTPAKLSFTEHWVAERYTNQSINTYDRVSGTYYRRNDYQSQTQQRLDALGSSENFARSSDFAGYECKVAGRYRFVIQNCFVNSITSDGVGDTDYINHFRTILTKNPVTPSSFVQAEMVSEVRNPLDTTSSLVRNYATGVLDFIDDCIVGDEYYPWFYAESGAAGIAHYAILNISGTSNKSILSFSRIEKVGP